MDQVDCDEFRKVFKYFKQKQPPPDLSRVIDFQDELNFGQNGVKRIYPSCGAIYVDEAKQWLKSLDSWKMFTLEKHPGLYFICNPFTKYGIEYWIQQSFESYCLAPNPTNIKDNIDLQKVSDNTIIQKLRWATLGYHHNWDTKEYDEKNRGEFPPELNLLSNIIARSIGFQHFKGEAAIVNYYALDSSIGGHTDHSEKNHSAPLISVSFGQTAVFLIGGTHKSVTPSSLFIRNGDIVIMSGCNRLSYHAVPRIIQDSKFTDDYTDGRWSSIMSKMRLNLNVRQVNL